MLNQHSTKNMGEKMKLDQVAYLKVAYGEWEETRKAKHIKLFNQNKDLAVVVARKIEF